MSRRAILIGARSRRRSDLVRIISDLNLVPRDLRVGVDGGVGAWKKLGLTPHFALGDWDSLENKGALRGVITLTLPKNKERSDLFYACDAALELGATEIITVGVTGGRPDHHLATLLDMAEISETRKQVRSLRAIGDDADYYFVSARQSPLHVHVPKGKILSVFAFGTGAKGVTLEGFQFPLKRADLGPSSLGLSNVSKGGVGTIRVTKGRLVVIVPHENS